MNAIHDQFYPLIAAGKLKRQRAYQLRQRARGLCAKCPHPLATNSLCLRHAIYERERQRRRNGATTQHNTPLRQLEKQFTPPALDYLAKD